MKCVHFAFPLLHICLFLECCFDLTGTLRDPELDFAVVIHSARSFLQETVELIGT